MTEDTLSELEALLDHTFAERSLLSRALTHKSFANEKRLDYSSHNERLEFLGDTILDFIISDHMMKLLPESPEGELSKLRALIVSEANISQAARALGLGRHLLLGRGEELTGGRDKSSLLANALEAVIASLYLDGGMDIAYRFVAGLFDDDVRRAIDEGETRDFKTDLQERCQSLFGSPPTYIVVGESGPDHQKVFEVAIHADGRTLGRGSGRSKKEAEQMAAKEALDLLKAESAG